MKPLLHLFLILLSAPVLAQTPEVLATFTNNDSKITEVERFVLRLDVDPDLDSQSKLILNDAMGTTRGKSDFHLLYTSEGIVVLNDYALNNPFVEGANDQLQILLPLSKQSDDSVLDLVIEKPGNVLSYDKKETGLQKAFKILQFKWEFADSKPYYLLVLLSEDGKIVPISFDSKSIQELFPLETIDAWSFEKYEKHLKSKIFKLTESGGQKKLTMIGNRIPIDAVYFDDQSNPVYIDSDPNGPNPWNVISSLTHNEITYSRITSNINLELIADEPLETNSPPLLDQLLSIRRQSAFTDGELIRPWIEIPWNKGDTVVDYFEAAKLLDEDSYFIDVNVEGLKMDANKVIDQEEAKLIKIIEKKNSSAYVLVTDGKKARIFYEQDMDNLSPQFARTFQTTTCEAILNLNYRKFYPQQ